MRSQTDDIVLENQIGQMLRHRGWRLVVAESCTGGLIAHRITNIPGSSDYFLGGIVAYGYEAKVRLLGVQWDTLRKFGAVSEEVVLEMACGARQAIEADIAVSVSGIAGPGGATLDKPVGLTWIGLSTQEDEIARRFIWSGDRLAVKTHAAEAALQLIREYLSR